MKEKTIIMYMCAYLLTYIPIKYRKINSIENGNNLYE